MVMHNCFLRSIISFCIIVTLIVSFFLGIVPVSAYAAQTNRYDTLDDIPEDLQIFKTIINGVIAAKNVNGEWYYQFSRSGHDKVQIKCSAFAQPASNNYLSTDNYKLNRSLSDNSSTNYDRICYYTNRIEKTGSSRNLYFVSMYRLKFEVNAGNIGNVVLKTSLTDCVKFTYSSKVYSHQNRGYSGSSSNDKVYVTPSTAKGFEAALVRSTTPDPLVPIMTLQVDNHGGSGSTFLSTYSLSGKGNASTSANISDFIGVIKTTANAIGSVATGNYYSGFSSLTNAIKAGTTKFTYKSNQYNTGENISLTKGDNYIVSTKLTSPIKISLPGDFVQYKLYLGGNQKGTTYTSDFSFK